ncbi:hypothetical protein, partial [Segatella sp.]
MASKIGTAVCGTARTVVWEVGKCENRRQMPFVISIYLLPDFLAQKFVLSKIIRIFAAREPAKPLNDAQMCGSFLLL